LYIESTCEKQPVVGEKIKLYKVADLTRNNEVSVNEEFDSYAVDMSELVEATSNFSLISSIDEHDGDEENDESANLAETLATYAERDKLKSDESGTTDKDGVVEFYEEDDNIERGIYLVIPEPLVEDNIRYIAESFLVALPGYDEGIADYSVEAYPKLQSEEIPDTTVMQVAKIWLDTGFENNRPNQIEAQLLRNGEVYDTQTLTKDNNWRYTWYDLDGQYIWKVLEKEVPKGYTLSLETEGYRAIMTNKIVPENSSSSDNTSSTETPEDPTTSTNQETPTTSTDSTTQDTPSTTEQPTNSATETTTEESTTTKKTSSGNKSSSSTSSNRTSTSGGSTTYTKASQKLPQTGQVWWPVPILGIAGLLCIILGVLRRDKK
jgi:hypothetical protein